MFTEPDDVFDRRINSTLDILIESSKFLENSVADEGRQSEEELNNEASILTEKFIG